MFKKRPNFLNSSPTSTESMLRLLSTPSGRIWQQTAICPVSLWALVIELHPLNWAHTQAARWINCQNLLLGALSSHSAPSVLVGELFKKFGLFLNMPCMWWKKQEGMAWIWGLPYDTGMFKVMKVWAHLIWLIVDRTAVVFLHSVSSDVATCSCWLHYEVNRLLLA